MNLERVDALIFDLDGTIIDSEPFTVPAVNAALAARSLAPYDGPDEALRGVTWSSILDRLCHQHPQLNRDALARELEGRFQEQVDRAAAPIPGVVEFITRLSGRLPMAIATSSPRSSAVTALERLGLIGAFSVVIGAEDYSYSKPEPDCFLLAAQRLSVSTSTCLVFEDSQAGVQAANAAAMTVAVITNGRDRHLFAEHRVDFFLENYKGGVCQRLIADVG